MEALVIKKQATNENDQIVTLYTKDFGKITTVAKSSLKNNSIQGMHLDVLNLIECDLVEGRGWPIITGAQSIKTFSNIKNDIKTMSVAYYFTEIVDKIFFENEKDQSLWDFLNKTLEDIYKFSNLDNDDLLKDLFKVKKIELLNILGYMPDLNNCSLCSKSLNSKTIAYNVDINGVLCNNCFLSSGSGVIMRDTDIYSGGIADSVFQSMSRSQIYSTKLIASVLK